MAFDINMDNVDSGLRNIVRECFSNILIAFGEKNFIRWLQTKRIDEKLKTLIVDYMTEQEVKKYTDTAGFMDSRHNRLAIIRNYSEKDTKGIMHHELDHFLSDEHFMDSFSGFINEGMTEYLKQLYDNQSYKSYSQNVDLVKFMHSCLGDIFVKAYFTGECEPVAERLKKYIGDGEEYEKFIKQLDKIYTIGYFGDSSSDKYKNLFKEGESIEVIANACTSILKGIIAEKGERLDFYKDGKLDINLIMNELGRLNTLPNYVIEYLQKENKLDMLRAELVGDIIDRTHLLSDVEGKARENLRSRYIQGIISKDEQIISEIEKNNQDVLAKLFEMKFKNFDKKDIQSFSDVVLQIVSRFPNSTERERHALISQYIIQKISGDIDVKIVDDYINANIQRGMNIDSIKNERERNTIESTFRMIGTHTAIEQRDNEYHIIDIKPDGTLTDYGVPEYEIGEKVSRLKFIGKNKLGKIGAMDFGDSYVFAEKLSDIQIIEGYHPYKFEDPLLVDGVMTLDDFVSYLKFRPIIEKAKADMRSSIIVENDAPEPFYGIKGIGIIYGSQVKDYRTRRIDLEKLRESFKNLDNFYANDGNGKKVRMQYLKYLTEYAYDIKLENNDEKYINMLYESIVNDDENARSMIAVYERFMNEKRMQAQESKVEDLVFENDDVKEQYYTAKEQYERSQKEAEEKRKSEQEIIVKQIEDSYYKRRTREISQTVYYSVVPDEEYETNGKYADPQALFGLPHLIMPQRSFKFDQPGSRKIELESFRNDMNFATERMEPEEREKFVRNIAKSTISSAYQLFKEDEQQEPEIKDDFEYMVDALYEYGMSGKAIDEERFEKANKKLNDRRQRDYKTRSIGAFFASPEIFKAYELLCSLSKKLSYEELIEAAKTIVAVHENNKELDER